MGDQQVVASRFEPKVSLDVDGRWLWIDVRYSADKFNVGFQEMERLEPSRHFIKQGKTWIKADKQTHGSVSSRIHSIPEVEPVHERFRTRTYHFDQVQSLLEQVASVDISEAYGKFRKKLEGFSEIEHYPPPHGLRLPLRPYQQHGYDWLSFLREYGLNGILADEMGLGKTVQAIAMLLDAHGDGERRTSLVVCPPSVLSAWQGDLKKFSSVVDFQTSQYIGSNRHKILSDIGHCAALLTTYTTLTRDIDILSSVPWKYVVLDEAQKIKNHDTATAKACKRLLADHKLAITGTPIENRLSELWSIYDFLMPTYLGTQRNFRETYEVPIMKGSNLTARANLRKKVSPFKLRREKATVASHLPPKIAMERYCELTSEQVQLYKRFATAERERIANLDQDKFRIDTSVLTAILRLKQICCHPFLVTGDVNNIYNR